MDSAAAGKAAARILLVDDEALVCDSLKRMLVAHGYEVATSPGGTEALAQLDQEQFDLIIIDYFMPGMKGSELAARIRARRAGQRIMMISASAELLQANGVPIPGADVLMAKPIGFDELGVGVAKALSSLGPVETPPARPQPSS